MEEFQYTLNVTPATVPGLDSMIITCTSAVQVRFLFLFFFICQLVSSVFSAISVSLN